MYTPDLSCACYQATKLPSMLSGFSILRRLPDPQTEIWLKEVCDKIASRDWTDSLRLLLINWLENYKSPSDDFQKCLLWLQDFPARRHQYSHSLSNQMIFEIVHNFSTLLFPKDKRQQQKMENKDFQVFMAQQLSVSHGHTFQLQELLWNNTWKWQILNWGLWCVLMCV